MGDTGQATATSAQPPAVDGARVHVFETGRLTANMTFLRGEGFLSLLRRVELLEFPALAFVIEHPEGLVAIDSGLAARITPPRTLRGFPPVPHTSAERELGPQLRARGLDPADVRVVVLTHLDWDHAGGLHHFPQAEVLVHQPEWAFAQTRRGKVRYRPQFWPADFSPTTFTLDDDAYGPFPASRVITRRGDLRIVPLAGHSPGQVGVVYESGGRVLLFAADHALRADWFEEDVAAERMLMMGAFAKRDARATSERLRDFVSERPTVLLPSHDADAPARLARREVTAVAR